MQIALEGSLGQDRLAVALGQLLAGIELSDDLRLHVLLQPSLVVQTPQREQPAEEVLALGALKLAGNLVGVGEQQGVGIGRAFHDNRSLLQRTHLTHVRSSLFDSGRTVENAATLTRLLTS